MSQLCSPSSRSLSIQRDSDSFLHRTYLCNLCSLNTPRGFSHASLPSISTLPPEVTATVKCIINPANGLFLTSLLTPRLFWIEPVLFAFVLSVNFWWALLPQSTATSQNRGARDLCLRLYSCFDEKAWHVFKTLPAEVEHSFSLLDPGSDAPCHLYGWDLLTPRLQNSIQQTHRHGHLPSPLMEPFKS